MMIQAKYSLLPMPLNPPYDQLMFKWKLHFLKVRVTDPRIMACLEFKLPSTNPSSRVWIHFSRLKGNWLHSTVKERRPSIEPSGVSMDSGYLLDPACTLEQ